MKFPFDFSAPGGVRVETLTLEEAIAYARHCAKAGAPWEYMRIDHEDGRSWTWEIKRGKPHLVEKSC